MISIKIAAKENVSGSVNIHAQTIRPNTPQFTADARLAVPTPSIAEEITCVVLSGTPKCDAVPITMDAVVSAAKP